MVTVNYTIKISGTRGRGAYQVIYMPRDYFNQYNSSSSIDVTVFGYIFSDSVTVAPGSKVRFSEYSTRPILQFPRIVTFLPRTVLLSV